MEPASIWLGVYQAAQIGGWVQDLTCANSDPHWKAPAQGLLKLNVDASVVMDREAVHVGGIVRNFIV